MLTTIERGNFKVIIVGAGVAGLTLANCLDRYNIDYIVLESRDETKLQSGSLIGVFPNGSRILDQLGIYRKIRSLGVATSVSYVWTEFGELLSRRDYPKLIYERLGYPMLFLQRALLIKALHDGLWDCGQRIIMNKKVRSIDHFHDHVHICCTDGSSYDGTIVVSADGIHSIVRREMWRHMEEVHQMKSLVDQEKSKISTEYSCILGQSTTINDFKKGEVHNTYGDGFSFLVVIHEEFIYWCFFYRYEDGNPLSHTLNMKFDDLRDCLRDYGDKFVAAGVPFSRLLDNATLLQGFPLEEVLFQVWCSDRSVCLGDAIHKMCPNLGQGGNSAIESAASFANSLLALLSSNLSTSSTADIHQHMTKWAVHRGKRIKIIWDKAHWLMRFESLTSFQDQMIAKYLLQWMGPYISYSLDRLMVQGETLQFLALPQRAVTENLQPISRRISAQSGITRMAAIVLCLFSLVLLYLRLGM